MFIVTTWILRILIASFIFSGAAQLFGVALCAHTHTDMRSKLALISLHTSCAESSFAHRFASCCKGVCVTAFYGSLLNFQHLICAPRWLRHVCLQGQLHILLELTWASHLYKQSNDCWPQIQAGTCSNRKKNALQIHVQQSFSGEQARSAIYAKK